MQRLSQSCRGGPRQISGEGHLPIENGIFEYWPEFLAPAEASHYCQILIKMVSCAYAPADVQAFRANLDESHRAAIYWYGKNAEPCMGTQAV